MRLSDLKLDNTRLYMVDVHGKKYCIKKQRGRYYIQHSKGQLTVTSAMKEKEWDLFQWYVLDGLFEKFPCVVMDWWMKMRMGNKHISI